MDEVIIQIRKPVTFNGPLEAGLRAVAILGSSHPRSFGLQRLVAFDYLLVHTGDIDGPASLHPPTPLQSAELLVRRKLVERALLLMMTRDLIKRKFASDGIRYQAGENAILFLSSMVSNYLSELKMRAEWLICEFGDKNEVDFRVVMQRFFKKWVEEFQAIEQSLGAE